MSNLENTTFQDHPELKPKLYARYVDDVVVIVDKFHHLTKLKTMFEQKSVLKFTFETEVKKKMSFLDTMISRQNNQLTTSVYRKQTNHGECLNYDSVCPDRYKTGVIKALLHRGYHVSSSWEEFSREIDRIAQQLTNNNYPMGLIERTVNQFVERVYANKGENELENKINIFFKNQMSTNYKQDEHQLRTIISRNVQTTEDSSKIKLIIFYMNNKVQNLFIKNNPHRNNNGIENKHNVVYRYICNRDGCNSAPTYLGYTTCTVKNRFRMHTQNSSSIKKTLARCS